MNDSKRSKTDERTIEEIVVRYQLGAKDVAESLFYDGIRSGLNNDMLGPACDNMERTHEILHCTDFKSRSMSAGRNCARNRLSVTGTRRGEANTSCFEDVVDLVY